MKSTLLKVWWAWVRPVILIVLVTAPLRSAVLDWNWVPSGSMKPTIREGELVLVNKLAYDLKLPFTTRHVATWSEPARGDVVVCFSPADGTRLVKRVVGLPGDTIELRNEVLLINGQPQQYAPLAVESFRADIFEDSAPLAATERIGSASHSILLFPSRVAVRDFGPVTVPAGEYFLLGDSRNNSRDSRFFGPVARASIVGRVSAIIISLSPSRYLWPRIERFFQPLS